MRDGPVGWTAAAHGARRSRVARGLRFRGEWRAAGMERGIPEAKRTEGDEVAGVRRADRHALALIGAMLAASILVNVASLRTEVARTGSRITLPETVTLEVTSHLAILALATLVPWMLNRWPVFGGEWRHAVPAHVGGGLAFSLLHVAAMSVSRKLLFPLVVGIPYRMNLFAPRNLIYELRKDVFTYALLLIGFVLIRIVEQRRREAEAALQTATREHKLTLKSGAAVFVVEASQILWAKAAANYVEVGTPEKTFLARMTLTALERLLHAAGPRHVRVHRSYVVNVEEIRELTPTGEGDVTLTLSDGTVAPASRRYRERLAAAMQRRAPTAPASAPPVASEARH